MLAPSVENIECSIPHLERAVACLNAAQEHLRAGSPDPAAGAGLQKLRASVQRVTRLVANGAAFQLGWAERLAVAAAGYTAQGEPAQTRGNGRLSVEG